MFVYSLHFFNLGLNLGAVPRTGRQSRCTYPFWVFASFFVLYYKFILYITRGAPNKAVKKKCVLAYLLYLRLLLTIVSNASG